MLRPWTCALSAAAVGGVLWVCLASAQTPEPLGDDYRLAEGYYDFSPDVDMDARGNFVVVWARGRFAYYGVDWAAWGRRFAADGRPRGEDFRLHDQWTADENSPEVAVAPDGRFAVVWHRTPFPRRSSDLWGRFYDATGSPAVEEFPISAAGSAEDLSSADIDINPKGDFVVVWQRDESSTGPATIQARRFSSEGMALDDEFLVNVYDTERAYFPAVHWMPDGGFLVVWVTIEGGRGQRYSSGGEPVGSPFSVHDQYASGIISRIDVAPTGQFVVTWMEFEDYYFDDIDIFARTFSSDAVPLTERFQVNSTTTGVQERPSVAMERGGEFIVVWNSRSSIGTDDWGDSVQGQRFSSVGEKVGAEFQVNTTSAYDQFNPSVAAESGKGFVVAWTSWEGFPYISHVRGRRFGPSPAFCTATETVACLSRGRFRVEVEWESFSGLSGPGRRVRFGSDDSALFWFFSPDNWEILVKVLDGCAINHRFWVFAASTTNLGYVLRVTDTETGEVREYENLLGEPAAAVTDTGAFATCG